MEKSSLEVTELVLHRFRIYLNFHARSYIVFLELRVLNKGLEKILLKQKKLMLTFIALLQSLCFVRISLRNIPVTHQLQSMTTILFVDFIDLI